MDLTFSPEKSRKIVRGWFGDTFQSTVIRSTAAAAIGGLIAVALIALVIRGEEIPTENFSFSLVRLVAFCSFAVLGYSCLGFLAGWGIAHWRYGKSPSRIRSFWLAPSIAGILLYSSLLVMIAALTSGDPDYGIVLADPTMVVFFLVSTAIMGVLASLFFRYALNLTPLMHGREMS